MESNTKTIAKRAQSGAAHADARDHGNVVLEKDIIDK